MPSNSDEASRPGALLVDELGRLVHEKRGRQSIRQAAAEADVSFTTLSRVESGGQPDFATFLKLCAWLGVTPDKFYSPITPRRTAPIEDVISHLKSDPALSPEAAESIVNIVRDLYKALGRNVEVPAPLVCHLRAAPVMRPGIPDKLDRVLRDMRDAIEERVLAGDL